MKTTKRRRRRPSGPDHFEGETTEDLMRELGIDDLTMESCMATLFEDLFEDPEFPAEKVYRVTQVGPPRRDGSASAVDEDEEEDHDAATS